MRKTVESIYKSEGEPISYRYGIYTTRKGASNNKTKNKV
jgi:hypothetical protein